nr:M14 family zinc carboxypeptidase [Comamonas testosteroni]
MRRLTAVGMACMLTACSTVQLPVWTGASAPPPVQSGTPPITKTTPASPAISQPVAPVAPLTPLPYNPAIEARFPDPSVRYETPGLGPNRQQFTTQTEMSAWLQSLAGKVGDGQRLDVATIGTSQRGLPLLTLIATQGQSTQATALNSNGKPTVLLVGQQRGDEPAGAEALLVIARELGKGGLLSPLLQQINIIIVPRANPDGAQALTPHTADGTDLARDHLILSTPEAQALAKLSRNYRPVAVIDLREFAAAGPFLQKFQAVQRYDLLLQPAATPNNHEFVAKAAREWFTNPMRSALDSADISNEWYSEPSAQSGDQSLSMAQPTADSLINASTLKNAASIMVASRGSDLNRLHIQRRVHSLVTATNSALRNAAAKAKNLHQVESFVTRDIASQACRNTMAIQSQLTPEQRSIGMLQADSGQELQARVDWNSSLTLKASQTRPRPCGYWVSASASQAVERLRMLGAQVMQIAEPGQMLADSYQTQSSSGNLVLTRGAIDTPMSSYYVSLNQAKANLIAAALEPDTPYSYLSKHLITMPSDVARVVAPPSVVFEEEAE